MKRNWQKGKKLPPICLKLSKVIEITYNNSATFQTFTIRKEDFPNGSVSVAICDLLYPKIPIDAFSDEQLHNITVGNYDVYAPTPPRPPQDPHSYIQNLIYGVEEAKDALEDAKKDLVSGPDNYDGVGTSAPLCQTSAKGEK